MENRGNWNFPTFATPDTILIYGMKSGNCRFILSYDVTGRFFPLPPNLAFIRSVMIPCFIRRLSSFLI
ncbi:MAG: hypothetical protein WCQ54_10985 [Clostridiaceae bacterium]